MGEQQKVRSLDRDSEEVALIIGEGNVMQSGDRSVVERM